MRTLIALFAAVAMTVPAHASKPSGSKPCGCNSGSPHAPSPSPAPAPTPAPSPPATSPAPSPAPTPSAPTPSPAPAPAPVSPSTPPAQSPSPSPQAARTGQSTPGGSWKPWLDAQYQRTLEPRTDYLPPDPVIAREEFVIPESTNQPSTVIMYEPIEVVREVIRIVEVPVIVERTVNVCPVIEKKPARKPIKSAPKVCK